MRGGGLLVVSALVGIALGGLLLMMQQGAGIDGPQSMPVAKTSGVSRQLRSPSGASVRAAPMTVSVEGRLMSDPSLDPDVLERAFAPPSRSLPREPRAGASAIVPPEAEWRRLQREEDAVLY